MKLLILILSIAFFFQSCKNHTKKDSQTTQQPSTDTVLQIENFTIWPEEVMGCSCYSSKNKEDFRSQRYLVIDDYFSKALIKVNGKTETLNLVSNDTLNSKKERLKIWKNDNFELRVETYEIDAIDEIWVHEGILKLTSNNEQTFETAIFGHCGC
ncbi:hypothetical protein FJ651_08955 [Paucihalobacter ruber]|uniref:Lipoprotein n=1 Tax=Paucihalobacter ruber TaxID=2567861 RepID=A0A506PI24_9FLAO|nr:hypothetical protein [Paucihalobacter ruber]TPV33214.1 hypothetical protein FJ651_08955 [Paucihalobacter ruber]